MQRWRRESPAREKNAMPRPEPRRPSRWRRVGVFVKVHFRSLTGLLLLGVMGAALTLGVRWLQDPYRFPLRVVKIVSTPHYLAKEELQKALAPYVRGGFFTVDVSGIHDAVEALPWVYRAAVQRVWPDRLIVRFVEQEPVARWGKDALLNRYGESFTPRRLPGGLALPLLSGPEGHERVVLEQYRQFARTLAPLGLHIARVELNERRAWRLGLDDAVELELGRADTALRLERFVRSFPEVFAGHLDALKRVDLRYSNGFSVYWQQAGAGGHAGQGVPG
jgi:cell division protein FtsQ